MIDHFIGSKEAVVNETTFNKCTISWIHQYIQQAGLLVNFENDLKNTVKKALNELFLLRN